MNITDKHLKIVVIAGEKSGEMHAAKVCKELLLINPTIEIIGWGGDDMKNAGVDVRRHINSLAIMGFWEVIKKIFFVFKITSECKAMILSENPDAILYVDYSGFNLRIANWAFKKGFKNYYYIAPKTWAWNQGRTKKLAAYFKKVYAILPFEIDFFKSYKVNAAYVGNPVLDTIALQENSIDFRKKYGLTDEPIVALVPGSRSSEIAKMLPTMCSLKKNTTGFQFVVSGVNSQSAELYNIAKENNIKIVKDDFYNLLKNSHLAIVTSGTATLETGILKVPQIVCYKTSWLSYFIGKQLIKVKFISLVNLICDELVVEELIQDDFTISSLNASFRRLVHKRDEILEKYQKLEVVLGHQNASKTTAIDFYNNLTSN